MAGGLVSLPQALQLISGVPLQKAGSVFAEKLSITKRMDGGAVGNLMKQVLADGNLSSIMQNPMAALTGNVQSQIQNALGQIANVPNAGVLVSALSGPGGLGSAASAFQAAGNSLAGLTNAGAGFFQMLGHDTTAQLAGDAMPVAYATSVVTAPLTASGLLDSIATVLPQVAGQVVAGTLDPATAAAWVTGVAGQVSGIVTDSDAALAWSAANHTLIAATATIGGALAVPPVFDAQGYRQEGTPTAFQGVLQSIVQPEVAGALSDALATLTAHTSHPRIDPDDYTSLEG